LIRECAFLAIGEWKLAEKVVLYSLTSRGFLGWFLTSTFLDFSIALVGTPVLSAESSYN